MLALQSALHHSPPPSATFKSLCKSDLEKREQKPADTGCRSALSRMGMQWYSGYDRTARQYQQGGLSLLAGRGGCNASNNLRRSNRANRILLSSLP